VTSSPKRSEAGLLDSLCREARSGWCDPIHRGGHEATLTKLIRGINREAESFSAGDRMSPPSSPLSMGRLRVGQPYEVS